MSRRLSHVRTATLGLVSRGLPVLAVAFMLTACDQSKPELEKALAQVQQISAEKDTLLLDVTATSQFIADLNAEIDKTRRMENGQLTNARRGETENGMSLSERRADALQKIKELTARVNDSQDRLAASRKRIAAMTGKNAAMKVQLAAYDSTIASFKSIIDNQKTDIASLAEQIMAMTHENTQLKSDNVQLVSDTTELSGERSQLTSERNTVYYIVGTKEGLLRQHIIEQTGGLLGIGKITVPARDLSPTAFTSIDKTVVSEIPFPKANTPYRVITRQDLSALETSPDEHGILMNGIKIKDPDAFWAASKYLIVIER